MLENSFKIFVLHFYMFICFIFKQMFKGGGQLPHNLLSNPPLIKGNNCYGIEPSVLVNIYLDKLPR